MVTGDDPVQAVYNLKDYIVHTHVNDGVDMMAILDAIYESARTGHELIIKQAGRFRKRKLYFVNLKLSAHKGTVEFKLAKSK